VVSPVSHRTCIVDDLNLIPLSLRNDLSAFFRSSLPPVLERLRAPPDDFLRSFSPAGVFLPRAFAPDFKRLTSLQVDEQLSSPGFGGHWWLHLPPPVLPRTTTFLLHFLFLPLKPGVYSPKDFDSCSFLILSLHWRAIFPLFFIFFFWRNPALFFLSAAVDTRTSFFLPLPLCL